MKLDELEGSRVANQIAKQLLQGPGQPPGAILLKGAWGAGKTYFWNHSIRPQLGDRKCIYLSLYGLRSIDQFKSRLVTASLVGEPELSKMSAIVQRATRVVRSIHGAARKMLRGYAKKKFDLDDDTLLGLFDLKLDPMVLFPKDAVVCIDDL